MNIYNTLYLFKLVSVVSSVQETASKPLESSDIQ